MKKIMAMLGLPVLAAMGLATAAEVAVPPQLEGWEGWVLHGAEHRRCPFLFTRDPEDAGAFRCAWPGRLQLRVDARGGQFSQRWQVYADSWVVLPGNLEHWPREVRANGAAAPVVERGGRPQMRLGPGEFALSGRFEWSTRPENLDIAVQSGLIDLIVDGQAIAQPERPGGGLSLGKAARTEQAATLDVQVYRLVTDDIPTRLDTLVRLQVAGDGREEVLGVALPAGFTPTALTGELPARLDADGRLRVQVRPGSHVLRLAARAATVLDTLQRPAAGARPGAWARTEIWSFAGVDRLRIASASGVASVDPAQVDVPPPWRELPAFRMEAASVLKLEETQRGLTAADDNRLTLNRQLWLDFDHGGYTARDTLNGKMRQSWRLDMAPPFRLESASVAGQNLLVTESPTQGQRGVEVRAPQVELVTLARFEPGTGAQPATGWQSRFEGVSGELNLPPGHRLLAAIGPDEAEGTWWSGWGLWSLFWIIVIAFLTYRLAGTVAGAVALAALLLTYQDMPAMIWLWANLVIAVGVASVVPEGRLRRYVHGYRLVAAAALAIALLPFLWAQIRLAVHPQLDSGAGPVMSLAAPDVPEAVMAPAADVAAAPPESPAVMAAGEASRAVAEMSLPAAKRARPALPASAAVTQRYAAGTIVQTGPGIPHWHYRQYRYAWNGPVEPADTVRFVILGPGLLALWRILGVALLTLWFLRLAQLAWRFDVPLPGGRKLAHGAAALLAAAGLAGPGDAAAQTPNNEILQELGNRLKARPACHPHCATLLSAAVTINGERLVVELEASALASVAVPIPSASDRWQIESVAIDGGSGYTALRESDGSLWVPLEAGARRIRLEGRVAPVATLQLSFPSVPRTVRVSASGWDVAGVTEGRLLSSAIELTRQRSSAAASERAGTLERGAEFPAFVRVVRDFALDLDWTVVTTLERIAPERASIAVEVPLLEGESVLTPGVEVRGGKTVLSGIPAGAASVSWQSGLARRAALSLTMPAAAERIEVWRFGINPQWHAQFAGQPAVLPDDLNASNWLYTYYPRPGESLTVKLTRPAAAAGATLAIDSARQWIRYGARSADAGLSFQYRSTQGGRHVLALPEDAAVEEVLIDGTPQQLRPDKGQLSIGLLPGEHAVEVRWRSPRGASARSATDAVDLKSPASNIASSIDMPEDRWVLVALAGGAGVGPAILYWSELVAFLLTAWALGRWRGSPLKAYEWLLLGLGLSTLSAAVYIIVVLWVLVMYFRASRPMPALNWQFNLVQVALALGTVIAMGSLIFSGIQYGLLSTPDMGITGPGSSGSTLAWFRDRSAGPLPQPQVFSVPMWTYKLLIIAWSLWVAAAMVRWLKWAWQSWSVGGYWRSRDGA